MEINNILSLLQLWVSGLTVFMFLATLGFGIFNLYNNSKIDSKINKRIESLEQKFSSKEETKYILESLKEIKDSVKELSKIIMNWNKT